MWGGCMLFRAAEMRGDARGILKVRSVGSVWMLVLQSCVYHLAEARLVVCCCRLRRKQ